MLIESDYVPPPPEPPPPPQSILQMEARVFGEPHPFKAAQAAIHELRRRSGRWPARLILTRHEAEMLIRDPHVLETLRYTVGLTQDGRPKEEHASTLGQLFGLTVIIDRRRPVTPVG